MEIVSCFSLILSIICVCESSLDSFSVDEYLEILTIYSKYRHISIWTHFLCSTTCEHIEIALKLSQRNIQSKFVMNFEHIERLVDTPEQTIQGFAVNLDCPGYGLIFKQEIHGVLFKNNNFWLLLDNNHTINNSNSVDEIPLQHKNRLNLLDILPVSELVYAKRYYNISHIKWLLYDVYRIASNYPLIISLLGTISEKDNIINNDTNENAECVDSDKILEMMNVELKITDKFQSEVTRKDLQGVQLKCGFVIAFPERYTYIEDPQVDHVDIFTKATIPSSLILREDMNFSCIIYQVDSYGWNINGTGKYNGAIGLFQKKKIQILAHGTSMRPDRLRFVEFTGEIFIISTPILFRQPPLSAIANIFILPLDRKVWLCYGLMIVMVIGIMVLQNLHPLLRRRRVTVFDVVQFVWGAVCQQGTHLLISTTSGRCIALTTFMATMAIFISYSANIVAILQSPSHSIQTLEDLLRSPLKVAVQETGYNRYSFMVENVSAFQKIYKKKVEPLGKDGWILDEYIGVEKIRTELFAFVVETTSAYKAIARTYTEDEKCSLSEINLLKLPMTTITVERNSGYKELFRQRIRRQREIGLISHMKGRWLRKKPICDGGHKFLTVGLNEIKPAILLLLIGFGISLLLLGLEIGFAKNIKFRSKH